MKKIQVTIEIQVPEDTTDNEVTMALEQAIGQITRFHNPEVTDIENFD